MSSAQNLVTLTFCLVLTVTVVTSTVTQESMPDGQTKMKIKAPVLSEEEQESHFIPPHMKCDGCKAVAFQLYIALAKAEMRLPKKVTKLPESEILDAIETVCRYKTFEMYSLKDMDGRNELSGPGIEKTANRPTMMQGGGLWPTRLANICSDFNDRIGEEEVYANFAEFKDLNKFEQYLCYGPASAGKFCKPESKNEEHEKNIKKEKVEKNAEKKAEEKVKNMKEEL